MTITYTQVQLTHTIKANLNLTSAEVANSNIVSLVATYVPPALPRNTYGRKLTSSQIVY